MTGKYALIWALLFLNSLSSLAAVTDTFYVKDAAQKLLPSERKYLQYTETSEGLIQFGSLLTRTIQKTKYGLQEAFLVIQTYQDPKDINRDSSYCDLHTLLPLAYHTDIRSEQYQEKVIFSDGKIDNTITFKDSIQQFIKTATGLYNSVNTDELISLLPLQEKKQFIFKNVNTGLRYFEYTTAVEVEGKEEISVPASGKVMCWRLRVSNGSSYTIQWYSVKGQQQLKKKFILKNGNAFIRVAVIA